MEQKSKIFFVNDDHHGMKGIEKYFVIMEKKKMMQISN